MGAIPDTRSAAVAQCVDEEGAVLGVAVTALLPATFEPAEKDEIALIGARMWTRSAWTTTKSKRQQEEHKCIGCVFRSVQGSLFDNVTSRYVLHSSPGVRTFHVKASFAKPMTFLRLHVLVDTSIGTNLSLIYWIIPRKNALLADDTLVCRLHLPCAIAAFVLSTHLDQLHRPSCFNHIDLN